MNGKADYVMAIDLGSSSIKAGLGKMDENRGLRILAFEQRSVDSEIQHGIVHNIEEVAAIVKELKDILSNSQIPPLVVNHVYTGINGYSLRTKDVLVDSLLGGTEIFTEKGLDELIDQIPENLPDGFNMVNFFTQEFLVDGKTDKNPIGSMPKRVEAHFKVVGGNEDVTRKTETAFDSIKLSCDTSLGPVATADAVLTPEDKTKGAVCVDFGAETTSVCIYKGDLIRYVSVLPFGGRNLTLDLLQLNMDEEDAERIKLTQGSATHYSESNIEQGEEPVSKDDLEINDIIVARIEEIVENIWAQISRSGIEPTKLLSGMVITGGASRLPGLEKLLTKKTGMSVRIGDPSLYLEAASAEKYGKPEFARCIGLILQGKNGCFTVETENKPDQEEVKTLMPQEQTLLGFPEEQPKAPILKKPVKPIKVPKEKKPKGTKFKGFISSITDFIQNDDN
jgi:cell division protein FtsA